MPTLSTSLRTTLSTAAREGINLHLVKNLGVPVKVPPGAAFALLRSNPRNAVRSNSHAGKETSWLSPEHQEHGKRTVRSMMLSGICMCWSNTEQWHSNAQQQLTAERGLPLAGDKTRTWPTGPEGGGTTVGLQTQPLPLWKSHRVLKITVFSFKLIQMDTAMPLKLAKIPLIASRTIFPSAIFIMLIHFRLCIYKEFPS